MGRPSLSSLREVAGHEALVRMPRLRRLPMAAATGLASVFLLGIESGTELGEAVSLNEVFGYFGIAAASAPAPRVVAGILRDRQT